MPNSIVGQASLLVNGQVVATGLAEVTVNTNDSSLPMGVGQNLVSEIVQAKTVKCKPGQGKLNRTIAKAQNWIALNGHSGKRFKRDYAIGVATYICPSCQARAIVTVDKQMGGAAITSTCAMAQGTGV